jgi:1-acyl-sn-glycerol-3-phosphate acyltransferase
VVVDADQGDSLLKKLLPSPLLGAVTSLLVCLNTVFWCVPLYLVILAKILLPFATARGLLAKLLVRIASAWVGCNSSFLAMFRTTEIAVEGTDGLDPGKSYLVVSNHRSWADIFVLQHVFRRRIPFLKFFLKRELIWVPILGLAWWGLDFPFMKRYSRAFLDKHPELRGKDMETTRRYCERFKSSPVSVINFLEGTRFDTRKHAQQGSPYETLLTPKAGGVALVLSSMGGYLTSVLDVSIAYPDNPPPVRLWALLNGTMPRVLVRVTERPVPDDVDGRSYVDDDDYRTRIQSWVNDLWQAKDAELHEMIRG